MDAVQPHYQTVSQYPKYIFYVENYFVGTRDATQGGEYQRARSAENA
jgi:hypothetical protein